ncbi:MAG: universal stress protein [Alphaproteobacteria bacterium]|nr:universal stress protein [Alphaproteobacteria bacterium]
MLSMLTLVRGTLDPSPALRAAATLQGAVGAELLVVCVDLGPPFPAAEAEEAREEARRAFDAVCGEKGGSRFKVVDATIAEALRKQAMFADLCALSRGSGLGGDDLGLLKAALVDGGVPTVLLPKEFAGAAPETVVLSWNGQGATARAIRAAAPFARRAKRVVVLEHAGNEVNRSRLAHFLEGSGIGEPDWRIYGDKSLTARGRARALLAAASDAGGDLLVMGAYGDAGERIFHFGRATEKVASAARIPVLFSC